MIFEVELQRDVPVLCQNLDSNGLISKRSIVTRLLEDLLIEKASEDHGYFLAVTSLKSIGKGEAIGDTGDVFVPVVFNCRIFMPHKGEVLQGTVYHVSRTAVFLRCGPTKLVFLSPRKMPNYYFLPGQNPAFLNREFGKIQKDVVVQFVVLDVRWSENRDFAMLASLEGKSLGPVSSAGSDELAF